MTSPYLALPIRTESAAATDRASLPAKQRELLAARLRSPLRAVAAPQIDVDGLALFDAARSPGLPL